MRSGLGLRAAAWLVPAYAVLAYIAIQLSRQPDSIAVVWFANALGIACVAHAAPRCRWAFAAATFAGNLVANLAVGDPLPLSLRFAIANTVEVMLGGMLLQGLGPVGRLLESPRMLLTVLAVGGLAPQLVGATLGAAVLASEGFGSFANLWPDWYVGSALGAIALLPLALMACRPGISASLRQLASPAMIGIAGGGAALALAALAYLPYPFILLGLISLGAALALPPLGSFFVCFVLALVVITGIDLGLLVLKSDAMHSLGIYLPALLSVLPGQLLAVAREQQRRTQLTLAALTSATGDLQMFFGLDGKVRIVNQAWERYWHRKAGDAIGLSPLDLVPEEHRRTSDIAGRVARAMAGERVTARVTPTFPGLGPRTMDVAYQPAFGPSGERVGVVFTAHDVSDMVAAQAQLERTVTDLRRANEGLEQFARIASHDLREPLNTIVQFSALIEDDHGAELPPSTRRYFELVKSGAQRMRLMLDDLLHYVRLEHLGDLTLGPTDLNEAVAQALAALHARIDARKAQMAVGPLPQVVGQASLLSLLFQNLVSNAVKFVPPDRSPQVRITAHADGEHVVVSVEDNGIGIEANDIGTLFEPFRRLHARRKFDGTGLGLAICRRIVAALGGTIELHSQPGVGTRVDVRLRRA